MFQTDATSQVGLHKGVKLTLFVKIIYPTFIRPHLEFASSASNPNRKRDIDTLEKVQRRATKKLESRHLSYENRIKKMGLTTLQSIDYTAVILFSFLK